MSNPPPKVTLDESLSALMDGELEELELHRVLKALPDHPDARAKWARYQLISASLQKAAVMPIVKLNIADAVQSVISESPFSADMKNPESKSTHILFAKFAVAASVAMMVVALAQWQQYSSNTSQPVVAKAPAAVVLPDTRPVLPLMKNRSGELQTAAKSRYQQDLFPQYGVDRAVVDANKNIVPLAPVAVKVDAK